MTSRILVTGAGGPAGASLGRQLTLLSKQRGPIHRIGVDSRPVPGIGFSSTDLAPQADEPGYTDKMCALVERHRPDLVIPTVQDELPQLSLVAEALGYRRPGVKPAVVIAPPGPTGIAADKLLTMWRLARAGVPVPRFAPASEFTTAAEALAWARGPVIVKPRLSRGGRGVRLIEHPSSPWPDAGMDLVVQQFASGTEYCPQFYRSPDCGSPTVVVLEKTELRPGRLGNSARTVRLADRAAPDVAALAVQAVDALGLDGPVDMDIRRDSTGVPLVLEVNGRFGANSAQAPEVLAAVLQGWGADA